jgi:hypothetical protein
MKKPGKDDGANSATADLHDQEVLRATRELAAYFKGFRTEREARAALKIIKAFVKQRERSDAARRRPLPGLEPVAAPKRVAVRTRRKSADAHSRQPRRHGAARTAADAAEPVPVLEAIDDRAPDTD